MGANKKTITAIHVTKVGLGKFRPWIEYADGTSTYAGSRDFKEPWTAHRQLNARLMEEAPEWAVPAKR